MIGKTPSKKHPGYTPDRRLLDKLHGLGQI